MTTPARTAGRLIAFRLDQVPLPVRMSALATLRGKKEFELLMAATAPSDRVYRVSVAAWDAVMKSPQTPQSSSPHAVSWAELPG